MSEDPLEILLLIANNIEKVDFYPDTKKAGMTNPDDNYNKFNVRFIFLLIILGGNEFCRYRKSFYLTRYTVW